MKIKSDDFALEKKVGHCVIIVLSVFYFLPFILFGSNSTVTIHDNLDQMIPCYKMYKDNGLFFKFDAPTKGFSEMSTLYYSHVNFSLTPLLYYFFDDFFAYVLNSYLCIILGFLSMHFLLKKMAIINPVLIISISACYAILPADPNLGIAVSTVPLIIVIFIHFVSENKFSYKVLLILFYPFVSTFTMTGIFILSFWFLGLVILGIRNKKINLNLLAGFFLLCVGYILVDLRLFYVMFVLKTPLNRAIYYTKYSVDIITQIKTFFHWLIVYGVNGHYHAASFQRKIIIPFVFIVSLFCLIILIRRIKKQPGTITARITAALAETNIIVKQLFLIEFIVLFFCYIAALYESGLMAGFIKTFISLLNGFNCGRVWIFNRVLWYVIFVLCLQLILKINIADFAKKVKLPLFLPRLCVWVLVFLQFGYIALTPVHYNDQVKTWFNEMVIKTGIAKKMLPDRKFNSFISYKEFFAKDLFEKIKNDISYFGEMVVAFGYHPSVLMYNGFTCIDGYNNAYPLSYMRKFRTLIAPELEIN